MKSHLHDDRLEVVHHSVIRCIPLQVTANTMRFELLNNEKFTVVVQIVFAWVILNMRIILISPLTLWQNVTDVTCITSKLKVLTKHAFKHICIMIFRF